MTATLAEAMDLFVTELAERAVARRPKSFPCADCLTVVDAVDLVEVGTRKLCEDCAGIRNFLRSK